MDLNTEQGYIEAGKADHVDMEARAEAMKEDLRKKQAVRLYSDAIASQCACNLSGLCMSMPRIAEAIWEEIRSENNGGGTRRFNDHPVMRLFAEQFAFLTAGTDWSTAYQICEEKVAEGKV